MLAVKAAVLWACLLLWAAPTWAHEGSTEHVLKESLAEAEAKTGTEADLGAESHGEHGEEHSLEHGESGEDEHAEHAEGEHAEGEHSEGEHGEGEEEEEEEEEEEHFSESDVEVAWMLLGSVSFVMFLFYLVTWPDDDIRRYTWKVLSSTISIFLAVLLFQGFNQLLELFLEELKEEVCMMIHFLHCLVYIVLLQLVAGYISGAMFESASVDLDIEDWVVNDAMREDNGTKVCDIKDRGSDIRNDSGRKSVFLDRYGMEVPAMKRKLELEARERRMKCYATLLAHMAGFAAIFAGGTMQHLEIFSSSPLMAFIPVVLTQVLVIAVFHIFGALRSKNHEEALSKGGAGRRAKMMNEEVEEAENDISALSMSFLTVQVVRFAITGVLPNVEGLEEPELPHRSMHIALLFGIGCFFAILSIGMVLVKSKQGDSESPLARFTSIVLNGCAMCFAWCMIWGTRWVFVKHPIFPIHTMMGHVILCLALSALSCLAVFGLDKVDDMHKGSEDSRTGAQAIQVIVNAIAILVGFSWEQTFDHGVVAVASQTDHPETVKIVMGLCITAVIMPMWRRQILMKSMQLQKLKEEREVANAAKASPSVSELPLLSGRTA